MTKPVKTIDQFTENHTYQVLWYQNTGLSDSEHTIKIVTNDKNPNSAGTYLNVDYFVYQTCTPVSGSTSTAPPVPVTGVDWPTVFLLGIGAFVILGSTYLLF